MREIKFRAWDTEKKEMAEVLRMSFNEDDITLMDKECGIWTTVKGYIAIPMQYTGFKDCNGVEIYEGDIIDTRYAKNHKPRCYEIKYVNGAFVVDEPFSRHTLDIYMLDKIPVVGNIYETPELLNSETLVK